MAKQTRLLKRIGYQRNELPSVLNHITEFHLLQCVALKIDAIYEGLSPPTQIAVHLKQFKKLFNLVFHQDVSESPFFSAIVTALCKGVRDTNQFMQSLMFNEVKNHD